MKKMFQPGKLLPHAYLTKTRKGRFVFRIGLNTDEILGRLEEGRNRIFIDIRANKNQETAYAIGNNGKGQWKAVQYYAWALPREEKNA